MNFETNWMELELTLRVSSDFYDFWPALKELVISATRIIQKSSPLNVIFQLVLRAILCKNQTKWEMKIFDPPLKFAWKKVTMRDVQKCQSFGS